MTEARAVSAGSGRLDVSVLWAWARIGFVLIGGMLVLQSSGDLDLPKVGYFAGVAIAVSASALNVWRNRRHAAVQASGWWFAWSGALILLLTLSFLVARTNGTPGLSWLRDAATYGLVALVPVVALDAAISLPRRGLIAMLIALGMLGACSWAIVWLERRAILDLPLERLLYAAPQIPLALYVVAMASAMILGRSGWSWTVLAGVVLGAFLITGTRSSLVYLIGPVTMAIAAGARRLPVSVGWIFLQGIVAFALVIAFQALISPRSDGPTGAASSGSNGPGAGASAGPVSTGASTGNVGPGASGAPRPDIIGDRIGEIGTVITDPPTDPSFKERIAQYAAVWKVFLSAPLLGVGPGYPIEWTDVSGIDRAAYTADTPLVYGSKFGMAGLAVLALLVAAYVRTLVVIMRATGRTVSSLSLIGFASVSVAVLPFGFPLEDKGMSFALIVILGLAFMELAPTRATTSVDGGEERVAGP